MNLKTAHAHAKKARAKILVESDQDEPSFEELEVTEKEAAISHRFTRPAMVTRSAAYKTLGGSLNLKYSMKTSSKLFNKIFHMFCVNIVRLKNLFYSV